VFICDWAEGGVVLPALRSVSAFVLYIFCFLFFFASFTRLHKKFINFFAAAFCFAVFVVNVVFVVCYCWLYLCMCVCVWHEVAPAIKLRPSLLLFFWLCFLCAYFAPHGQSPHTATLSSSPGFSFSLKRFFLYISVLFCRILSSLLFFCHILHAKYATANKIHVAHKARNCNFDLET